MSKISKGEESLNRCMERLISSNLSGIITSADEAFNLLPKSQIPLTTGFTVEHRRNSRACASDVALDVDDLAVPCRALNTSDLLV